MCAFVRAIVVVWCCTGASHHIQQIDVCISTWRSNSWTSPSQIMCCKTLYTYALCGQWNKSSIFRYVHRHCFWTLFKIYTHTDTQSHAYYIYKSFSQKHWQKSKCGSHTLFVLFVQTVCRIAVRLFTFILQLSLLALRTKMTVFPFVRRSTLLNSSAKNFNNSMKDKIRIQAAYDNDPCAILYVLDIGLEIQCPR